MRFHSTTLAALATIAASIDARMEEPAAPTNEAEFVSYMAAKMEKAEAAPAPAANAKGDEPIEEEVEEVEEPDDADEGDDPEEGPGESDEDDDPAGGGEDEVEGEGDDDEEVDSDPEFSKAAASAKLPTELEDLPEEARPIVQKRLKDMEAGFTRAMQRANDYRAAERKFRTEEAYREAHPVEWLAEQLAAHPELEGEVAAQLEKLRDDPDYRESRKVLNQRDRDTVAKEVAKAEAKEREHSEWLETRSVDVESLAKETCRSLKIPFDRGVEAAIAYEIREKGDIENARIKEIVEQIAVERGASIRAHKREAKKELLRGKKLNQERAPKLKPGQGRAGGSTREQGEPTLEQNFMATAQRLFPGER